MATRGLRRDSLPPARGREVGRHGQVLGKVLGVARVIRVDRHGGQNPGKRTRHTLRGASDFAHPAPLHLALRNLI
jgi:hypothetical protein